MQTTKAVGPDIVELFDIIRMQAQEYTEAFAIIRQEATTAREQREAMQKMVRKFEQDHNFAMTELREMVDKTLQVFEEKTNYIRKTHSELAQIHSLRQNLEELRTTFGSHNSRLEAATKGVHKLVERQVGEEFSKLERKVAHRLKQDQEDIAMFDKRLQAIQDYQRRELNTIGEDVDDFKNKITETKYIVDETQKIIEFMISRAEADFELKIEQMEVMLEEQKKALKITSLPKMESQSSSPADQLSALNSRMDKRIKQLEKRLSTITIATAFAAIVFFIMFALVAFRVI
ncbi:MAG TPA: hypothetical protein VEC36_02400 [Patescibacteria group bacterium]|nr:hypothetical protein [Patescibacteria group bacterium]